LGRVFGWSIFFGSDQIHSFDHAPPAPWWNGLILVLQRATDGWQNRGHSSDHPCLFSTRTIDQGLQALPITVFIQGKTDDIRKDCQHGTSLF